MAGKYTEIDEIDGKITAILSQDASVTNAVLAQMLGLSTSATNDRVRRLKKLGIIKRISAFIDANFMEMDLCAFINIDIAGQSHEEEIIEEICEHLNVMECHKIANIYSYSLKVRFENSKKLNLFCQNTLEKKLGVKINSINIVLNTHKEESVIVCA